jgi:dTMP kinase
MTTYDRINQIEIPQRNNMFAIEGIDGSGKSTQSKEVVRRLEELGIQATRVTSPSDGVTGQFVRKNIKTLKYWERNALFLLDFIHSLRDHPDSDEVLIWDRYVASGYTSNKDMTIPQAIEWLSSLPQPTRTYLLDIEPNAVLKLREDSAHDHSADTSWQEFKRGRYMELASLFPGQIQVIDAIEEPEKITEIIIKDIVSHIEES